MLRLSKKPFLAGLNVASGFIMYGVLSLYSIIPPHSICTICHMWHLRARFHMNGVGGGGANAPPPPPCKSLPPSPFSRKLLVTSFVPAAISSSVHTWDLLRRNSASQRWWAEGPRPRPGLGGPSSSSRDRRGQIHVGHGSFGAPSDTQQDSIIFIIEHETSLRRYRYYYDLVHEIS